MGLISELGTSLRRRDDGGSDGNDNSNTRIIISVVSIVVVAVIAMALGCFAYWRKKKTVERHRRLGSTDDSELQTQQPETSTTSPVRRNTNAVSLAYRNSVKSIASIMTLPPYKEVPGEQEEVIAREGEREGLDFIVEGPETAEELEHRRQEEVAAIYRVQQTRRRELEERSERRRARRSALDRQDYREVARLDRAAREARLRERNQSTTSIGQDSQASGNSGANSLDAVVEGSEPSSGALLAELQEIRAKRGRVASISYAELGVQRHDGSRLRATSMDSDSQPLLDAAGIMGQTSGDGRSVRSRASSVTSNNVNANGSPSPTTAITPGRERSRSRASRNGAEGDPSALSMQLSEDGIPHEPPSYDDDLSVHGGDAPRYEDVVLDTPRQSVDIANAHPDAEFHDEVPNSYPQLERTPTGPKPTGIPLRLQTSNNTTPSIEIVVPTPVQSRPTTPLSMASGTQRSPVERR